MSDNQTSFATLGQPIGVITQLTGSVVIESIDGQERIVNLGDPVFFGELIKTGTNASVTISFVDGTNVLIGNNAIVEINDEVYNSGDAEDLVADSATDADALQEAILAGEDPTLIQEAPAAGETIIDQQDRVDVSIDRNDNSALPSFGNDTLSTLPTYGYDTNNGANSFIVPAFASRFDSNSNVDTQAQAGTVTIDNITQDNRISAQEAAGNVAVTGTATGGDISQGDTVTLQINGQTYRTQVAENGTWAIDVAGSDFVADNTFAVVVASNDGAGNSVESIGSFTYTVDLVAEAGTVTVDAITQDDVINAQESGETIAVTGTASGGDISVGDAVTLEINGQTYTTQVTENGTWTVDVAGADLVADTAFDVVVTSSDIAGNSVESTGSSTHTVDLVAQAGTVTVNAITQDDVINAAESEQAIAVSGTAEGGDIAAGDTVTLVINNTTYTTQVAENGTWTVDVAGADLAADTAFDAVVTSSDAAGNTIESTVSSTHTVDLAAEEGTVTVNAITQDDVISATESEQGIAVTGTADGVDISVGDTVTLVINDNTYTTTVNEDGTWTVDVAGSDLAADAAFDAVVTSFDAAGNIVESRVSSTHTVDLAAEEGTVTVNAITQDDVINAAESAQTIAVTGTAEGGDIANGDTVTLVINDNTYTTQVAEDGTWSVDVAGADLAADTAFDAVVTSSDAAGNMVESTVSSTHTVDLVAQAGTVTVNSITEDDVINAQESGETIELTGTASGGDISVGDTVTLVINNTTYTTQVAENGTWTVDVAGADLVADTAFDAVVTSSDAAGNTVESIGSSTHTVDLVAQAGTVTVNTITQDDVINAAESEQTIAVTGTANDGDISVGDTVTLVINNTTYTTQVAENGTWSVDVAGADLVADTEFDAVVTSSDAAGNIVESRVSSTHTVDLAAEEGTVTVNAITQDDVINAAESEQTIAVTGTANGGDISVGDTVTLVINDKTYTTTVNEDGTWTVDVAGADLVADTAFDVVVMSSDAAGNTVESTVSSTHTVDTEATAGTVTVNAITQDDVINATEAGQTIPVTGTASGGDISVGDTVTLVINNTTYTTQVAENGTWSVGVAGADLAADTEFDVVVASSDEAGNTVNTRASSDHSVDLAAEEGTVTVNSITEDDVINAQESGETIAVTGRASGGDISVGDTVTLVINDNTYSTTVNEEGTWTVDVAGSDLAADTEFDAVVTSSDAAGNIVESRVSSTHTVDLAAEEGTVTVNAITQDDVINAAESEQTIAVTGTAEGGDISVGDTVTLEINDITYTTTVGEDGTWSVDVAGADLAADAAFDAVVTSSDAAGNMVESTVSSSHTVDLAAEEGTVTVNSITEDDVINAQESGETIAVTGTASGGDIAAGDTVTLVINNTTYTTQVAENGTWTVDVAGADLMVDTAFDAVVTSSDTAGNMVESTGSSTHAVDTEATAGTVTVNAITQDDVINATESGQTIPVTGTADGGDIAVGDTVTLVINNTTYTTQVTENGTWSVDVAGADLVADTAFDVVVMSSDAAGNSVESTGSSTHTVDLVAQVGTVTVNAITQDDVINATESEQTIAVTGTAEGGDIAAGDTVTLVINDITYTTTVGEDGTWSVDVAGAGLAADTEFDAVVTSSDAAGNTIESTGSSTHTVDLVAQAGTVTVNNITEDDVINAAESEQTIAVTGTAEGGDIAAGDTVTLEINDITYTTTVGEDGTWSVDVAGADLAADAAFDAVVTSSDTAGNIVESRVSSSHTVDLAAEEGTVTVNSITEDDVINAQESGETIAVTGMASGGDISVGDTVTLVINNTTYTTQVAEDGTWSVDVAGADLAADTAFDAVVTSSDAVGNTVESRVSSTHTVDLAAEEGTVTVNSITEDDVINAAESEQTIAVTGTASGGDISVGDTVTLVINNTTYSTQVAENGTWTVDVAGADLVADTAFDAVVSSSDAAGNSVESTGSSTHTVDLLAQAGTVTVNNITEDDVINAQESGETIELTGTASGGDISVGDAVTLVINDNTYTTTVGEDGTWSVDVAGADLAVDTVFDAVVTSSDAAGNTVESMGSSTHTVDIEATAGTVTVNNITEDDVINAQESGEMIAVTGMASGGDIAAGDTVTLVINNTTYTTQVTENGTWTVDVAGADLAADTEFDAVVTSSDEAGNTVNTIVSSTHTVDLAAQAGTVTVNAISQDDVINAAESEQTIAVTGTASGGDISVGDTVTLEINGQTYTTQVAENGTWTVDVAGADLAEDTEFDALVTSSDAAGNSVESIGSSTHTVDLTAQAGTVTVGVITQDDVINAAESEQTIPVTGTASGGDISVGDTVTLEINGQTYTTQVAENGTWTVDVAGADLAADTNFDAVVMSSDAVGNSVESIGASTHMVDTEATAGTVIVNNITEDDVINAAESEQSIAVSGTATGGDIAAGDTVTLVINNNTYTTMVGEDGSWAVDVAGSDLAADTEFDAVVTSSDTAGNTVDSIGASTHTVDTEATAGTVTVNNITEDDVINAAESEQTIAVSGTATSGDIATGDTVTLEINGQTYTTQVAENGTWSVDVAGADLAAESAFDAVVTSSDAAGNTVESIAASTHTVDLAAQAGTVTVDAITQDDVINASEAGQTIPVAGTASGGDIAAGDTVTLEINGQTYTTQVAANGTWTVNVAGSDLVADTEFEALVTSSDAAGNTVESTGSSTHTVDLVAQAGTVTVDAITQDDLINAAEASQTIPVTGTAMGGDISAGDMVTLVINNTAYRTQVTENGTWTVDVSGADLAADAEFDAVVRSFDAAGNRVESIASSTHTVDTEAMAGTVTVNNITEDDVINAQESGETIVVTGTASGGDISIGDTVTLEINGQTYTTQVAENGTWTVDVAGADLAVDTEFDAVVTSFDAVSNRVESIGSSTHTVDLAAQAGTVTVGAITQDDVINAAESEQTIAVSGTATGGDIAAGDTVTLEINGQIYTTQVAENGTWTVDVAGADLAADTEFDAVVMSSDVAGNTVATTGSSTHTVDTEATAGTVTVNNITEDDVINAAESEQTISVTGTASGGDISVGDTVTLVINNITYSTQVTENGTWTVDVAGADLAADTEFDVVVSSSDVVGNTVESTGSSTHTVDTEATAGTVMVGTITQDDVINAAEAGQTILVTGTASGGDISVGDTVTLVINNSEYTTTVNQDGTWSVDVAGADLAADTAFDALVTSFDAAGNRVESTGSSTHEVDLVAQAGTVTINAITQDDVINAAEAEQTIAVSGTATGGDIAAGDTVTLEINGQTYTTQVAENGTWTVNVAGADLVADTEFDAVVTSSDNAGNAVESIGASTHTVDTEATAGTVTVNAITQDDVINAAEAEQSIAVTGTASGGDIAVGDTVTLVINNSEYTTRVNEDGTWSVDVAGADLVADTAFDAVVTSSDAAGNRVESTASSTHTVDTEATAGTVTVNNITEDDVINAAESEQTIAVTGTASGGDISVGDIVTLVINNSEYTTTVNQDGTWAVDVAGADLAADTAFAAVVTSSDDAGNTVESRGSSTHTVDTEAMAGTVTVNSITQDNVINAAESEQTIPVTGTASGGDISVGDTVTLVINNTIYTTQVSENGTWTVDVAGSDLAVDTTFDAVVTSSDTAGNTVESIGSSIHSVDTEATAGTVTVNAITQDDVINAAEAEQTIAVTGTALGGDIAVGDAITLEINGQTYTTQVAENGAWTVDVAGADLAADTEFNVVVTSFDTAGNRVESIGSSTHAVDTEATAGTVTVNNITEDDVINAAESEQTISVTGTASGGNISVGDTVTLVINDNTYTTMVGEDGSWTVDVAGSDLAADTQFDAVVTSSDTAGNRVESIGSSTHTVDTEATAGTVTVNAITQDDVINAAESEQTIPVTGTASGGDISIGDTVTLVINDITYTTQVAENGTWSVDVSGSDLAVDTRFDAVVTSSDAAGNSIESIGSSTHTVDLIVEAGTVTIGAITQDDVINAAESEQTIAVTGTAGGGDISAGDTVTLEINDTIYTTTVAENGTWTVNVAGADLVADTEFDAVVTSSDPAGNTVESTASSTHMVDTEATAGTVTVNAITQDDVINAAESAQTITVTGTADSGDIAVGDTVTLEINSQTYTTQVAENGTWTVDVAGADLAADTNFDAVVTSFDAAGNRVESIASSTHTVDTEATAGIVMVATITQDDVINATEAGQTISVTGTAEGGDIIEGDTVTLEINGQTYTTQVTENGTWAVDVAGADLAADTQFDALVTSFDDAGNRVESTGSSTHTVDLVAQAGTVTVDAITRDDVINATEAGRTIAVTGTAEGGDISVGDTVTLEINGQTYTTQVVANGTWTVDVAGSDLVADTAFDVVVASNDDAGNAVESIGFSTHTVDLVAQAGTVTIDAITQDDLINAAEAAQTIPVTGTAEGGDISAGDTVRLEINGQTYTTKVAENGTWSVDVAGADLAADTEFDAVVTSSDAAGNRVESTGSSTHTVDLVAQAGTVAVNAITQDDVINATEAGQTIPVTGTASGGDIAAGDTVTLVINNTTYTSQVAENGTWTVDVAGADLVADTEFDAVVLSSDAVSNRVESIGSSSHTVDLAAQAGTVTVGAITQDDVINAAESDQTIAVTGTAEGGDISIGDTVTLVINNSTYTTQVTENGTWSVDVAGADLAADTNFDAVVTSSDAAGNTVESTGSSTHMVDIEATAGTVIVNNITEDDVINAAESEQTISVTGTASGGDISVGDMVTLIINNSEYITTVNQDGTWSVDVAGADLVADTEFDAVVTSSDAAGNVVESIGSSAHTVDLVVEAGTVTVGAITQDDVINAAESEQTIAVTGTASGGDISVGDTVTLEINGQTYTTQVVGNGTWTVDVAGSDLVADTEFDALVTSSDAAGNSVESIGSSTHAVDLVAQAGTVTVGGITQDDVINAAESEQRIAVTGTAEGGDISVGDTVTLVINNSEYTTTVKQDGTWSVDVAGSDLAVDTAFAAVVSSSDAAGNTVESTGYSTHTVDTEASDSPVITSITDDSVDSDYSTVTLHGTGEPGNTITLYVIAGSTTGGIDTQTGEYKAVDGVTVTVDEDGNWSLDVSNLEDVPVNDNELFKVTQTDSAGNESGDSNVAHYWHGSWSAIGTEAGDDYVLLGEGNDYVQISADDTNDALTLDGGAGTDTAKFANLSVDNATITRDANGNVLIVDSSTSDVVLLVDFENVTIEGTRYSLDELFTPTVEITEDANNDGYISSAELSGDINVSVTLPIGANEGDSLTINGTVTVLTAAHIAAGIVLTTVAAPAEGETLTVEASISDTNGNTSSTSQDTAVIDTMVGQPTISLDAQSDTGRSSSDGVTNDSTPTFTIGNVDSNVSSVEVFDGANKLGDAQLVNGEWTFTVSSELVDGDHAMTVVVTDVLGNTSTSTELDIEIGTVTALDDTARVEEDNSVTIDVLANDSDVDGDDLSIQSIEVTSGQGTVEVVDGKVVFTPADNYNGEVTISYVTTDGNGQEATAEVTVDVAAVDDASILEGDSGSTSEDTPLTVSAENGVLANDSDIDSELAVASFSVDAQTANAGSSITISGVGVLTIEATGAYEFVPADDWSGTVPQVTYTTNTGQESTLDLSVAAVADMPTLSVTLGDESTQDTVIEGNDISDLGRDETSSVSATREFDFGAENAGKTITLSFDSVVTGTWDPSYARDADSYNVSANGELLESFDYDLEGGSQSQSNSYTVTLDGNGIATVTFEADTTGTDEELDVSNIVATLEAAVIVRDLNIAANQTDSDGSETLTYTVSSLPDGASLRDSEGNSVSANEDGSYSLTESQVDGLQLVTTDAVDDDFDIAVTITSSEATTSETVTETVTVDIDNETILVLNAASVTEDSTVAGDTVAIFTVSDEDDTVTVDFTAGTNGDGYYAIDGTSVVLTVAGEAYLDAGNELPEISLTTSGSDTVKIATATPNTNLVNDAAELSLGNNGEVSVSEEGLSAGNVDTSGSSDSTNAITASGTFSVSDEDGDSLTISLVAPTASYTSNGETIVWSTNDDGNLVGTANGETIVTVSLGEVTNGSGSYTVTLSGPLDHSDTSSEDVESIQFGITVSDGTESTTENITVNIEDDSPDSVTMTASLELGSSSVTGVSTFSVSSIEGGFESTQFTSGNKSNTSELDSDNDSLIDEIEWNDQSNKGGPSGYQLSDESSISNVSVDSHFVIGLFTHENEKVNTIYETLDSTRLTYTFDVEIDGETKTVTLSVDLDHDETTNNGNGNDHKSDDTVTMGTLPSTEIEVNGVTYKVSLAGFMDSSNNVVTSLSTEEESSQTVSIVASITAVSSDTSNDTLTGTLTVDGGAEGGVVTAATTEDANGSLVVTSDGSYTYTPSETLASSLESGESTTVTYSYSVVDSDGDTSTNTLEITVTGSGSETSTVSGLSAEFYNYSSTSGDGVWGNIDNITEALRVIDNADSPNATFTATEVNYTAGSGNSDLGMHDHLEDFIGDDASSLTYINQRSTDDSVMKLSGSVTLDAGTYRFKITADDGYQIKIDGEVVAEYAYNQGTTTRYATFEIDESGSHDIEIVYWDQYGGHQFTVSLADDSGVYSYLGSDAYPTSHISSPSSETDTVTSTGVDGTEVDSLQDRIDEIDDIDRVQSWSGSLQGTDKDEDLRGHGGDEWSSRDTIDGGAGDDVLIGGNNQDTLIGGEGDDYLLGGLTSGEDWATDTLTGGEGDDIFILTDHGQANGWNSWADDVITDFNAADDSLDLTDILDGMSDAPDSDADKDAIAEFLNQHVSIEEGAVKIDGNDVATFGDNSDFDSNQDGSVNTNDSVTIIFNDQEYIINVDG